MTNTEAIKDLQKIAQLKFSGSNRPASLDVAIKALQANDQKQPKGNQAKIEQLVNELSRYHRKDIVREMRKHSWFNDIVHADARKAINKGMSEALNDFAKENFFIVTSVLVKKFGFGETRLKRFCTAWYDHVTETKAFMDERRIDDCISPCRQIVEATGFDYEKWNADGHFY